MADIEMVEMNDQEEILLYTRLLYLVYGVVIGFCVAVLSIVKFQWI